MDVSREQEKANIAVNGNLVQDVPSITENGGQGRDAERVTRNGNPRKPEGGDGEAMLRRMNSSHAKLTGWALGFWNIEPNDAILDIGCGGGETLHRMSAFVTTGHLTGIDYSQVSVRLSRETNAMRIAIGQMDVVEGSVESLPFEDGTFDKVVTVESFYFWPNPQENLREVHRVMKDGGTFLLVAEIYENGRLGGHERDTVAEYNMNNPTEDEFVRMFCEAGFAETVIHTKDGVNWICVEGRK